MTVDQFYDLGVALGFTIQQLDVIEYRRFRDREQAIYDMLVTWRERQPSGQAAKETFLSLMESIDSPAEETAISDIGPAGEIPDRTLLAFARQIRPKKFYEIGGKLGFNKSELQHIQHRTLYNRNNANIQMLSRWKASQTSGPKANQTLKLKDVHALNDPYFQPVKVDDDEIVFREGTLTVGCQLGEQSPEPDGYVTNWRGVQSAEPRESQGSEALNYCKISIQRLALGGLQGAEPLEVQEF
eukprot:XP_011673633.1 PREDICTED: uncharacterized protein LOC105442784 [Strongylocentrotus purpuratus]